MKRAEKFTAFILILSMILTSMAFIVSAEDSSAKSRKFIDTSMVEEVRAAEEKIKIFESGETKDGVIIFDSIEELEGMTIHQKDSFLYQYITHLTCVKFPASFPKLGWVWKDLYRINSVYSCKTCSDVIVIKTGSEYHPCGHQ